MAITVQDITTDATTIRWTPGGEESQWLLSYKAASATPWNAEILITGDPEYTLTGLAENTYYEVRVRTLCAAGDTSLFIMRSFRTICESITEFPWIENFDSYGASAFPPCMSRPVVYSGYPQTVSTYSVSAPYSLRFQSNVQTIAITPHFEREATDLMVTFKLRREGTSSGKFQVGVVTDPADMNSFVMVQEFNQTTMDTWQEFKVILSTAGVTGAHYIGFKQIATSSFYYYWLDDVEVDVLPEIDIEAISIAGPTQPTAMTPNTYHVTVKNRGLSEANGFTVSVMTEDNIEMGEVVVTDPLASEATRIIPATNIVFTEEMIGSLRIKAMVMLAGDEIESNNTTSLFEIEVIMDTTPLPPYTVNITTNSGASPAGAVVSLTGEGSNIEPVTATTSTVIFQNVPFGTYRLDITLAGFHDYTSEVTISQENSAHNAVLIEISNSITNYEVNYSIYPNPAANSLTVERSLSTPAVIELYNAMGMRISRYETNDLKFDLNVAALSSGTYFTKVIEGDKAGVKSIVKK